MTSREDIDERLARLTRQTAELRPRPGFSGRVLLAIQAEAELGIWASVARGARRFVPVALLLALGAVSWAVERERSATLSLASSYAAMELEW